MQPRERILGDFITDCLYPRTQDSWKFMVDFIVGLHNILKQHNAELTANSHTDFAQNTINTFIELRVYDVKSFSTCTRFSFGDDLGGKCASDLRTYLREQGVSMSSCISNFSQPNITFNKGLWDLSGIVKINPDHIKSEMPHYCILST